jgi:hypothetical protein
VLYHCDKIPEVNNLSGGEVYFGSLFQRFQFRVGCSIVFVPVVRQSIKAGSAWWSKAVHIMVAGIKEETRITFKVTPPPVT